jgi:hypothetical protein
LGDGAAASALGDGAAASGLGDGAAASGLETTGDCGMATTSLFLVLFFKASGGGSVPGAAARQARHSER